jgi:hypothetical protein
MPSRLCQCAAILAAIDLDPTGTWAADHLDTAVKAGVA